MEEMGVTFKDIQNMDIIKNDLAKATEKIKEKNCCEHCEEKKEIIQDDEKNLDLIEAKGTIELLEYKLNNYDEDKNNLMIADDKLSELTFSKNIIDDKLKKLEKEFKEYKKESKDNIKQMLEAVAA